MELSLWQVFRFAAPALMAGNGGLLKHASNVLGLRARDRGPAARRGGLPGGLFRTLLIGAGAVGALIERPEVAAVTLTGSTPAGRSVAAARRGARSRRPCSSSAGATRT